MTDPTFSDTPRPEAKLCECGCGQPAPIADRTRRGYAKGQPMRFVRGHFSRTDAATPPPVHIGSQNPKWRGDNAGYRAIHIYLNLNFPKSGACTQCGAKGPTDYALIHGREYTRDRGDYRELCRLCHNRYDEPWEALERDQVTGRWVA